MPSSDRGTALRVVTSHPGKQVVVYETAAQLASRRSLVAHLAAVYYDPARFPYTAERYLPSSLRRRIGQELRKRRREGFPDGLVDQFPWVELAGRAALSVPAIRRRFSPTAMVNAAHDLWASRWIRSHTDLDFVLAHQGSAFRSLTAARECGATPVLVATHPLTHERIVAAEYAKFGARTPMTPAPGLLRELGAAEWFLTASAATTEGLLEHGVPLERIKEIPYGLNPPAGAREARQPTGEVRFVFVGKLSLHKGLHVLRDAWAAIRSPNVSLTLVGRPVGEIEARILREWNDPRVRVVAEVDDISTVYRDADVFVFPSLVEGFGMVSLEAMSLGLPVIATERCPGVARRDLDGLIVPAGSVAALADAIARLADDSELRARFGASARTRAHEFTWDRFGGALHGWLSCVKEMS